MVEDEAVETVFLETRVSIGTMAPAPMGSGFNPAFFASSLASKRGIASNTPGN